MRPYQEANGTTENIPGDIIKFCDGLRQIAFSELSSIIDPHVLAAQPRGQMGDTLTNLAANYRPKGLVTSIGISAKVGAMIILARYPDKTKRPENPRPDFLNLSNRTIRRVKEQIRTRSKSIDPLILSHLYDLISQALNEENFVGKSDKDLNERIMRVRKDNKGISNEDYMNQTRRWRAELSKRQRVAKGGGNL